jgi:hypothetical protein
MSTLIKGREPGSTYSSSDSIGIKGEEEEEGGGAAYRYYLRLVFGLLPLQGGRLRLVIRLIGDNRPLVPPLHAARRTHATLFLFREIFRVGLSRAYLGK